MEIDSDENCGFMVGPELDDASFFFFLASQSVCFISLTSLVHCDHHAVKVEH